MRFARYLGLLLMALLTSTVGAAASTVTWEGLVSANSSIELVLAGTLAADSTIHCRGEYQSGRTGQQLFLQRLRTAWHLFHLLACVDFRLSEWQLLRCGQPKLFQPE